MLRIVVISLVVANLLLLGFQSSKPSAPVKPRASRAEVVDADIPTIHLFSEMLDDQELIDGNRRCFSLGPFHSIEDRDAMYERLLEVAENVNERQTQALVEKGYWVFIPAYSSYVDANQAVIALQALGLQDVAVIYSGEWEKAISLGYFMRQENAVRRKQDLEQRGYAPMMRVQRQSEPRYWLDYEQKPGAGLIALDMQGRPNDFSSRATPCPEQEPPAGVSALAQGETAQVLIPAEQEETPLDQEAVAESADAAEDQPDAASQSPSIEPVETAQVSGDEAAELIEEQVETAVMPTTTLEDQTGAGAEEPSDAGVESGAGAEEPGDAEAESGDGNEELVDPEAESNDGVEEPADPDIETPLDEVTVPE